MSDNEFVGCTVGCLIIGLGGLVGDALGFAILVLGAQLALASIE
jgi:hypothetical protein